MQMELVAVGVAEIPDGKITTRSGRYIGKGLAIADITPVRSGAYSITHIHTGHGIGGPFHSRKLAARCAREMIRLVSFEGRTGQEVRTNYSSVRDLLLRLLARYQDYDEQWEARRPISTVDNPATIT